MLNYLIAIGATHYWTNYFYFFIFLNAAYFQNDHPIYSAKRVRFRMGYSKLDLSELETKIMFITGEEEILLTRDENYVWTYTSPEYPMSQVGILLDILENM